MLARALAKPSNLIVLDEPTNDLDIETLDLLQELLSDYAGTIIIVSHDRDFLDRVATSVIAAEGNGRWVEYSGGYSDMVAQRGYGLAGPLAARVAAAEKPRKPPADRTAPRRKLGFNERRALDELPQRIEAIRAELDALESKLADAGFPVREPAAFMSATKSYAELREALGGAEDEWLGLEILREELERQ
jgi:ABC transport system ATP-binding/permease protein